MSREYPSRRDEVMHFIELYYAQHGISPNIREIVAGTEYTSTSAVWYILQQLKEEGRLTIPVETTSARAFVPTWLQEKIKDLVQAHVNHSL